MGCKLREVLLAHPHRSSMTGVGDQFSAGVRAVGGGIQQKISRRVSGRVVMPACADTFLRFRTRFSLHSSLRSGFERDRTVRARAKPSPARGSAFAGVERAEQARGSYPAHPDRSNDHGPRSRCQANLPLERRDRSRSKSPPFACQPSLHSPPVPPNLTPSPIARPATDCEPASGPGSTPGSGPMRCLRVACRPAHWG